VQEAQELIDAFYAMFPRTLDYVESTRAAVYNKGYVETAWGRRRYFFPTGSRVLDAALEREAVNHPIQGTVAGSLDLAIDNFRQYKKKVDNSIDYRLILPVHDALLTYVRKEDALRFVSDVVPVCMALGATIPALGLTLRVDTEIKHRWDDKLSEEEISRLLSAV
jgi:DNA polymerase I